MEVQDVLHLLPACSDVRFSPDGNALYVVDVGAIVALPAGAGPTVQAFPKTGAVWRIVRDGPGPVARR